MMMRAHRGLRAVLCAGAATALLSGCVERRLVITSDPTGAAVELNGVDVGRTPLEVDFTYYGVYDVLVSRDGYDTLRTTADADAPWYEWPGIDIVSQATPPTDRTLIEWHFVLVESTPDETGLLERARRTQETFAAQATSTEDVPATPTNDSTTEPD